MRNNGTWIVTLGADPEQLTLGSREVYKLRVADKGIGKGAVTLWFTALVGGPDLTVAARLAKGNTIALAGALRATEYAPKKPRFKGEKLQSLEMPFGKIMQVIKSETFFNQQVGDLPPDDSVATNEVVETDGSIPDDSAPNLEGL